MSWCSPKNNHHENKNVLRKIRTLLKLPDQPSNSVPWLWSLRRRGHLWSCGNTALFPPKRVASGAEWRLDSTRAQATTSGNEKPTAWNQTHLFLSFHVSFFCASAWRCRSIKFNWGNTPPRSFYLLLLVALFPVDGPVDGSTFLSSVTPSTPWACRAKIPPGPNQSSLGSSMDWMGGTEVNSRRMAPSVALVTNSFLLLLVRHLLLIAFLF